MAEKKPVDQDKLPAWMREHPNLRARREESFGWREREFKAAGAPGEPQDAGNGAPEGAIGAPQDAGNGAPPPGAPEPRPSLPAWLERLAGADRGRMEMGAGPGMRSVFGGAGEQNENTLPPWLPGAKVPHEPTPQELAISTLLTGLWRQGEIYTITFLATAVPQLIRPREDRKYLFIQNQDPLLTLTVGFNQPPGPVAGIPSNGLLIPGNFGFYEPLVVPQGEIWVAAGAVAVPGVLLYYA